MDFLTSNRGFIYFLAISLILGSCKDKTDVKEISNHSETTTAQKITKDAHGSAEVIFEKPAKIKTPEGMVWIPGGIFKLGAVAHDKIAMAHEKPSHEVTVNGFFMDVAEVTNAQFKKFVDATGYITVAEREIDWEVLKEQLPAGTPKPHDSIMQPGSLTFRKLNTSLPNLYDFSQWWQWTIGANWKNPKGPGSTIVRKKNHPVVHIAFEDAVAYCEWAGRRLPTEAEWERAARGSKNSSFWWGDDAEMVSKMANSWEGEFPLRNTKTDGYEGTAPVKSYPANENGLFDIAGNVWEWTSDWYNTHYYSEVVNSGQVPFNPTGSAKPYNQQDPYAKEKVIKGGSFLCNASYCASYRISARMATSLDSSLEHLGFRTVATIEMLAED
jgi:formylglycine-generating enzyme required for sulfatase activity